MATAALFENAYERKDIYRWNGTERDARSLTCSSHAFSQKKPEDYPSPHPSLSYLSRDFLWICVLFFYLFIGNIYGKLLGFKLASEMSEILSAREIILQI